MSRNHLKHELSEQQQRLAKAQRNRFLPMEILAARILPNAFDTLQDALNVLLVCKVKSTKKKSLFFSKKYRSGCAELGKD
jgi:hypothetical protein